MIRCKLAVVALLTFLPFALSAQAATLLVVDQASDSLLFLDGDSGQQLGRLQTPPTPIDVAVSHDGHRAVVTSASEGQGSLTVIDVATITVLRGIDVGASGLSPHGIAFFKDGRRVIVSDANRSKLAVYDLSTGDQLELISLRAAGAKDVTLSRLENRAWTSVSSRDEVELVSSSACGGQAAHLEVVDGPRAMALTADGENLWVSQERGDGIMVIDEPTVDYVTALRAGAGPGPLAMTPDGRACLVTNQADGDAWVYYAPLRTPYCRIELQSGGQGHFSPVDVLVSDDSQRALVSMVGDRGEGQLVVVDLRTFETTDFWLQNGERPAGMAWVGSVDAEARVIHPYAGPLLSFKRPHPRFAR